MNAVFRNTLQKPLDLGAMFSPSQLFSGGRRGAWFLPSDSHTLLTTVGGALVSFGVGVGFARDRSPNALHAVQATASNRPLFGRVPSGGKHNFLTRTEEFNTDWVKSGLVVESNVAIAPDGTMTADKLVGANGVSGGKFLYQSPAVGAAHTVYLAVKAAEYSKLRIIEVGGYRYYGSFDLVAENVSNTGGANFVSAAITPDVDGWYICEIQTSLTTTGAFSVAGFPDSVTPTNTPATYTGDGVSGIYVWGAQANPGASRLPYQRVGSQYDILQAGKPQLFYIENVSSDSLSWTAPTASYTVAYLGNSGVTIAAGQALSGATNIMQDTQIFEYIAVEGGLGSAELRRLQAYLDSKGALL